MPVVAQKRDAQEEMRQRKRNEMISMKSIVSCSPKDKAFVKLFIDPNVTSDFYAENIGASWSFIHHSTHKIGRINYFKGHLVSPRGGHQPEIGFIEVDKWDCTVNVQP